MPNKNGDEGNFRPPLYTLGWLILDNDTSNSYYTALLGYAGINTDHVDFEFQYTT